MPNLPPQTVVAECQCAACGKPVKVKLNKAGKAYYFCPWATDQGDPCNHHQKWGGAHSQQMQRNYLSARSQSKDLPDDEPPSAAEIHEQPQEQQPAGTNDQSTRDPSADWDVYHAYG